MIGNIEMVGRYEAHREDDALDDSHRSTMTVYDLSALTWEEVRDLPRSQVVAILPTGALEAHGPHLPLGTDMIIAEAMARRAGEKLSNRGHHVVLLPTLGYTAADFAAGFPGTLSLRPETVTALIQDVARSLATHRFTVLAIANAHLDPAHIASIEAALEGNGQGGLPTIVFPDIARKPWVARLTDEFKSGACHAGQYESSVVLAAQPELVRERIRKALPANPASLSAAIRSGMKSFEEAGGPRAYFGYPADADAEEGARTIEILGSILEEAVLAVLP
jgi:creatinine amidohydrolase